MFTVAGLLAGCEQVVNPGASVRNNLDQMKTARIQIDEHEFEVWLARTSEEVQRGLMQVTKDQLSPPPGADGRGMLFIFKRERPLSFWMYNCVIPIDVAYIHADGTIIRTWTMAPHETQPYPSGEPAMYALELYGGLMDELGIKAGMQVEFPDSILKQGS
jgi:hypothetical protein